jgi:ATP-binding cassette subfamily B protein
VTITTNSIKIENELRNEMYLHQQSLSQSYFSKQKVGAMMSLYLSDLKTMQFSLGFGIVMICDAIFLTIATVIQMMTVNVIIALIVIFPLCPRVCTSYNF